MSTLPPSLSAMAVRHGASYAADGDGVQLAMFGTARSRRGDPATSKAAADALDVNRRCAEVLEALRAAGPSTARELARDVDSDANCVARRLGDLRAKGLAEPFDVVLGSRGRMVWVWRAT